MKKFTAILVTVLLVLQMYSTAQAGRAGGGGARGGARSGASRGGASRGSAPRGGASRGGAPRGGTSRGGSSRAGAGGGGYSFGSNDFARSSGPGSMQRPGVAQRPSTANGRGQGTGYNQRGQSNRQDTRGNRQDNRNQNQGNRQDNRNQNQGNRQDNRNDRQGNRQDNRGDRQNNRQTNRGDRTTNIGSGNTIVNNPAYGGGYYGWNGGMAWYPAPYYWGGGFWGAMAIGVTSAAVFGAIVDEDDEGHDVTYNSYEVQAGTPGATFLTSYQLTQAQCGPPNLVEVYGPENSVVCANPNSLVGEGKYRLDTATLSLESLNEPPPGQASTTPH